MSDDTKLGAAGHLFIFKAEDIAEAAAERAKYHRGREAYWRGEFESSLETVKETAGIKVIEMPVTGGSRVDIAVDYGDLTAHHRMLEAQGKIDSHRRAAERFESDAHVYGTQSMPYSLTREDVHHFGLGGERLEGGEEI